MATLDTETRPARHSLRLLAGLLLVLSVAIALRFWRIDWGLAARSPFVDELTTMKG